MSSIKVTHGLAQLPPSREVAREERFPEAEKRIGERDPDDADILALALHLGIPVWSNDNDFEDAGIEWYTMAQLLKRLGSSE